MTYYNDIYNSDRMDYVLGTFTGGLILNHYLKFATNVSNCYINV